MTPEWLTWDSLLRTLLLAVGYWLIHSLIAFVVLVRFKLPDNSKGCRLLLAGNVMAGLFALLVSGLALTALQNLGDDFVNASYPPLIQYCRLGTTFFLCDLMSLYRGFMAHPSRAGVPFLSGVKTFACKHPLPIVHHLALAFVCIPFAAFVMHDKGHIVVAVVVLQEASTPFFSTHSAMRKVGVTSGRLVMTNGFLFLVTFFVFRVCAFPYLYWRYLCGQGMSSVIEALAAVNWYCHTGSLLLASLQYYWFYAIFRRFVAQARKSWDKVS